MRDPWSERVICGVIRQTLSRSGRTGLISVDPEGPELELFRAILVDHAPDLGVHVLSVSEVEGVLAGLNGVAPGPIAAAEARRAVARARAAGEGLLPVSLMNRTALFLATEFPPEPLIPLGDLPASTVRSALGSCTLPPPFDRAALSGPGLTSLEEALDRWAAGVPAGDAATSEGIPDALRPELIARLRAGPDRRALRGIVPKLGNRTPGIDLDF